jgi:uncharacterized protein YbjT (DUF2867 family)
MQIAILGATGRIGGHLLSWALEAGHPVERLAAGRPRAGLLSPTRPAQDCATINFVTRVVHVPYAVEQDEDGVWCATAQLRPGVGAVGDGSTQEAAIADLREALEVLLAEVGSPDELTLTLDVGKLL